MRVPDSESWTASSTTELSLSPSTTRVSGVLGLLNADPEPEWATEDSETRSNSAERIQESQLQNREDTPAPEGAEENRQAGMPNGEGEFPIESVIDLYRTGYPNEATYRPLFELFRALEAERMIEGQERTAEGQEDVIDTRSSQEIYLATMDTLIKRTKMRCHITNKDGRICDTSECLNARCKANWASERCLKVGYWGDVGCAGCRCVSV